MIGKDGSQVRFDQIADKPSGCPACAADKAMRAFCPAHRGGRPCTHCAGRGYRVSDMRWIRCNHT